MEEIEKPTAPEANTATELSSDGSTNDSDMVEIHEATVEDLDQALAAAEQEEASGNAVSEEETPPEKPIPSGQPELKSEGVATTGAEPSKPARTYTQEEIQGILAKNERQKKEGNQKELFIQHRNTELGRLRSEHAAAKQQLAALKQQLASGLEDRFSENPIQAVNDRDRIKEIDSELEGLDQQETRANKIVEAQTFFLRHVDTEKVSIDDVAATLKADGLDDRYVAQFKANPWEFTTPEALVQMGKRAMDRKGFTEADNDRRILAKHVLYLNGELSKQRARPGQIMAQVQRHLNQAPSVTAASTATARTAREVDPTRMSTAELDAALQAASRN